jgi:hypothetical protein
MSGFETALGVAFIRQHSSTFTNQHLFTRVKEVLHVLR